MSEINGEIPWGEEMDDEKGCGMFEYLCPISWRIVRTHKAGISVIERS